MGHQCEVTYDSWESMHRGRVPFLEEMHVFRQGKRQIQLS